jgi:hypothetical protein
MINQLGWWRGAGDDDDVLCGDENWMSVALWRVPLLSLALSVSGARPTATKTARR